jgi:hypothetical protein
MCVEKIRLHAKNMITTRISSKVNIIGGGERCYGRNLYDHLMSTRNFTLIKNKTFI